MKAERPDRHPARFNSIPKKLFTYDTGTLPDLLKEMGPNRNPAPFNPISYEKPIIRR